MKTRTLASILCISFLVFISCAPKSILNKDKALADSLLKININSWNSGSAQNVADMNTEDCLYSDNGKYYWTKDSILAVVKISSR